MSNKITRVKSSWIKGYREIGNNILFYFMPQPKTPRSHPDEGLGKPYRAIGPDGEEGEGEFTGKTPKYTKSPILINHIYVDIYQIQKSPSRVYLNALSLDELAKKRIRKKAMND